MCRNFLASLSNRELSAVLRGLQMAVSGSKAELLERLEDPLTENPKEVLKQAKRVHSKHLASYGLGSASAGAGAAAAAAAAPLAILAAAAHAAQPAPTAAGGAAKCVVVAKFSGQAQAPAQAGAARSAAGVRIPSACAP